MHRPARSLSGRLAQGLIAAALASTLASAARAEGFSGQGCGNPFKNHYGPFDYRSHRGEELNLVEHFHFTPGVESLTRPVNTTMETMAQDVGYTLHVFPNHARALMTMTRLGEKHKTDMPPGASFTVECYLWRAVRFAPDDTVPRSLYARYLAKKNRKEEALAQLAAAEKYAEDNAISHFNIGVSYFEMGEYERAVAQAQQARTLGLEWPQLIDMLKRANKWHEPAS